MGNIRYQRTAHRITSAVNCRPLKPSPRSIYPAAPYPTGVLIPVIPPPPKFATEAFGLAVREPLRPRRALTRRTVSIAARSVGDAPRAAIITGLDMAAQRRRAARHDRAHHAPLGPTHMSGVVAKISLAVPA